MNALNINALTDKFYSQRTGFILPVKNMSLKHIKMVTLLVANTVFLVLNIILQPNSIIKFHLRFVTMEKCNAHICEI